MAKNWDLTTTTRVTVDDVGSSLIIGATSAGAERVIETDDIITKAVTQAQATMNETDWGPVIDTKIATALANLGVPKTTGLAAGRYELNVDSTGNETWVISNAPTPPPAGTPPPPSGGTVPPAPVINTVAGDNIVSTTEAAAGVTITGTAEVNSTVTVTWGGRNKTYTATSGTWTVTYTSAEIPSPGTTTVTATARNTTGTGPSASRTVTVESPPSSGLVAFGDHLITSTSWLRLKGGAKIQYDSLMNNQVGGSNRMVAHRFRATASGNVASVRLYWIASATSSGYSSGTGGTIRIRVYPCGSDNKPNLAAAYLSEAIWSPNLNSGGYPVSFSNTNQPIAMTSTAPLVAGSLYCVVYENIHSSKSTNWLCTDDACIISGNQPINPWLADTELAVLRGTGTASSATWTDETNLATKTTNWQQIPNVAIVLAGGAVMGNMRAEGSNTRYNIRGANLSSTYPARSRIVAPVNWTVIGFSLGTAFSVAGDLLVELKNSTGTTLKSATITQSSANVTTQPIANTEVGCVMTWYHRSFPSATAFTAGQTFYLQYTPQGAARCWFQDIKDFRAYGYPNIDHTHQFHAEHYQSGVWKGFNWASTTSADVSTWRDVIHLA